MKLMNLKGTFDFLPKDMKIRNNIITILRNNFEKYGYLPIETSILNHYELLSYKYDNNAEILHEIYKLTDQGERELALRYDLTVPFCKVVGLNKDLSMPFRRYEIGKVFRNGPVKLGRTREFYQCDVDVVGIDNRYIEAEQMSMAINIYKELGIDIYIRYNNRKLMSGLIMAVGIEDSKIDDVIGIMDKKDKVSHEELVNMLKDLHLSSIQIDHLFTLFDKKLTDFDELINDNELIKEGINELKELNTYLQELGIFEDCVFSPTLARGLSIYTGLVFEFYDKAKRLTCALGAGGRYNKIITNFMNNGQEYPAIGLSFGLEPIFVILKEQYAKLSLLDIYMVPLSTDIYTLKLANTLRKANYRVLIEMNKKKIGKCFEYAERENIHYVMVVGENEVSSKTFKIKDMVLKQEYIVEEENLVNFFNERSKK